MSLTINSNLNSLAAQRQLGSSGNALAQAVQRLSSGLRVNSAADDAAGLAISQRMSAQINGASQAARNTNDGISLTQTADSALASISDNLQRIRQLAVQSANGTNSASDRAALQSEASQLIAENDRIASQTQFNGINLLDGSFNGQQFQVGANRQQTVNVGAIANVQSSSLGTYNGIVNATLSGITIGAPSNLSVTLNGPGTTVNLGSVATDAQSIANAVNQSGVAGLTAQAFSYSSGSMPSSVGATNGTAVVTINGVAINVAYTAGTSAVQTRMAAAIAAINTQSATTGVQAFAFGGFFSLSVMDGRNLVVSYSAGTATGSTAGDFGISVGQFSSTLQLSYQAPAGTAVSSVTIGGAGLGSSTQAVSTVGTALNQTDISTVAGANAAISSADAALNAVNSQRANLGALQNRFQSAIANLQTSSQNTSAARSRITDADFAQETANLSRNQILQQAGTAMVAQANQQPQGVLALLR